MDDDTGWFIQDQQTIILVQHFQRNRFTFECQRFRSWHIHRDAVTRLDFLAGLDHLLVDADAPQLDQALQRGT